jgi:SNF family Na+-dependent transporter
MVEGGGSSFIMIYFLVLILVCLPIFILEINYGVFTGKGVVKTFGSNNRLLGTFLG